MAATMTSSQALAGTKVFAARPAQPARRSAVVVRAGKYDEELIATAGQLARPGRGLLAIDESNATAGKRLDSIGGANSPLMFELVQFNCCADLRTFI